MEPSQRISNLKPWLSKRKTIDILSLNIKLQKEHKAKLCANTVKQSIFFLTHEGKNM